MEDTTESSSAAPPWIDPFLMDMDSSAAVLLQAFSIPPNTAQHEMLSYEDLLLSHNTLRDFHRKLLSEKLEMQAKIDYWTNIYTYVEKGIAIKITEITKLKRENTELKTQIGKLSKRVEEGLNSANIELVKKRIVQLEDQVRTRDLVIDLMKKAEKERIEKETQEKLDLQRQQFEEQLGLEIGSTKAKPKWTKPLSVWTAPQGISGTTPSRSLVNIRPKPGVVSAHAKSAVRPQVRRSTRRTTQKRPNEENRTDNAGDAQMGNRGKNTANFSQKIVIEPVRRDGHDGNSTVIAEDEAGTESDKVMEELFGYDGLDD